MIISALISLMLLTAAAPAAAVVTENETTFTLHSKNSGELHVSTTVVVNEEKGLPAAYFYLYCDAFRSLKSFSGTLTPAGGKPVKLKSSDLVSNSLSPGLVDDGKTYVFAPAGHYPLTVHYEYTVSYHSGISSFPVFFPVDMDNLLVEKATYTLSVPADCAVQYVSSRMDYDRQEVKGRTVHRWTMGSFGPMVPENMRPPARELLPYVYSSPEVITLGGFEGSQKNWADLGRWLYGLQKNSLELTPEEVSAVKELTAGCTGTLDKLTRLHAYFRERTRYVSIQLGIGGLRPIPAKEVSRAGFGDCKGLSNYLRALLAAADVPSDYFIINTDNPNLLEGYASVGQMNHAMLAVPVPEFKDTVWVECTNTTVPLGYRHSNAAGHQVVLVKEDGGELLRIPAYADTLSLQRLVCDVALAEDGSARVSATRELYLDNVDSYLSFSELRAREQAESLCDGWQIQAREFNVGRIRNNFTDYAVRGKDFVPELDIPFDFTTGVYGNVSGNRMFVPVNPCVKGLPIQKSTRVNDLSQRGAGRWEDCLKVHVPEGYRLEAAPEDVVLDTEWGTLVSRVRWQADSRELEVTQVFTLKRFRAPAARYGEYRDFARAVNRAYTAKAVFVKE
jgi:transglutaminase-like putative cysteine protease